MHVVKTTEPRVFYDGAHDTSLKASYYNADDEPEANMQANAAVSDHMHKPRRVEEHSM